MRPDRRSNAVAPGATANAERGTGNAESPKSGVLNSALRTPHSTLPILRRPAWQDLDESARQIENMNAQESRARSGINFIIPRFRSLMSQGDWRWRELREGGCLHAYLNRMRAKTSRRWRAVGRGRHGFKQNPKSEFQLLASVPAYDYYRFIKQDRNFWRDISNLKALRRDNSMDVSSIYV